MNELTKIIEDIIGFKLGVTCTSEPIPIKCVTFMNGLPKEEGMQFILASSKKEALNSVAFNIRKYLTKNHCSWRLEPEWIDNDIRCRIFIW